ncbi:hypothetical protein L210DRAFT_3584136 [Boletus edulis BED1]|uniref:Uncharacterized protein n=1 Tax=Boletus edulis BED1 TaxID=1328754 RepID=A0AAD4BBG0_BOLED|nr:hypothetical protein L210DRAFT_3584136 [Boletus edulis BED1]
MECSMDYSILRRLKFLISCLRCMEMVMSQALRNDPVVPGFNSTSFSATGNFLLHNSDVIDSFVAGMPWQDYVRLISPGCSELYRCSDIHNHS